MAMRLAVLSRFIFLLLAGSVLVALVISRLYPPSAGIAPVFRAQWDSLNSANWALGNKGKGFYLIDRESGVSTILPLSRDERWGLLSVSPWTDEGGKAEAVGHCYSPALHDDGEPFWGLVRLSLPDAKIVERIRLDVLPIGRPCWVPDRPNEILFAGSDGNLYHTRLEAGDDNAAPVGSPLPTGTEEIAASKIKWRGLPPGGGAVVFSGPVRPSHPQLRRFLFAGFSHPRPRSEKNEMRPLQIWWFMMSDDGREIEDAGELFQPAKAGIRRSATSRDFPNVSVSRNGTIELVYLARHRAAGHLRLEAVEIEVDSDSGRPRAAPGRQPCVLADDCAYVPPVFSADGESVFAIARRSGELMRCRIDGVSASDEIRTARR
jgi:hypothetical protein